MPFARDDLAYCFLHQHDEARRMTLPLLYEINRNVVAYCRILSDTSANGTQGLPSILFTPNLTYGASDRGTIVTASAAFIMLSLLFLWCSCRYNAWAEQQEQESATVAGSSLLEPHSRATR